MRRALSVVPSATRAAAKPLRGVRTTARRWVSSAALAPSVMSEGVSPAAGAANSSDKECTGAVNLPQTEPQIKNYRLCMKILKYVSHFPSFLKYTSQLL